MRQEGQGTPTNNPVEKIAQNVILKNQNSCIPKNDGVRQRQFDEVLRADLEWHSQKGRKLPRNFQNHGGDTNTETLIDEINIGGKSDGYRPLQSHKRFQNTSSRAIFLSVPHT